MTKELLKQVTANVDSKTARQLAIKVFALNFTSAQLAEFSGLTINQIYGIKCLWVNKQTPPSFMKVLLANGLIKILNKVDQVDQSESLPSDDKDIDFLVIALMIEKSGLRKTEILLKKRGKSNQLKKYLKTLTSPQLADIV